MSYSASGAAPPARFLTGPNASAPGAGLHRFGRYVLCGEIARGGMATVHLARTESSAGFRKWVAIKTIHSHLAGESRFVQMFFNEARLAARLDHPNIGTVFDFGQQDATFFLAMEFLRGEPLSAVSAACRERGVGLPWPVATRIVIDAARGLHAAHELRDANGNLADLVHRDVSPQNIFVLYDGVTKVVDFGVARSRDNVGEKTATGEIKGKLGYMAPEQILCKPIDRRVDLFALGTVLWELLAQRRLFRRDNDGATIQAILMEPIAALPATGLPNGLEATIRRALERDPNARFATLEEFARALERVLASSGVTAGTMEVSDFMRGMFDARIADTEAQLRRLDSLPDPIPANVTGSMPGIGFVQPMPGEVSQLQRRSSFPLAAVLIPLLVVVGGGVGVGTYVIARRHSHASAPEPSPATIPAAATQPAPPTPPPVPPPSVAVAPTVPPAVARSTTATRHRPASGSSSTASARTDDSAHSRSTTDTSAHRPRPASTEHGHGPGLMTSYENGN